MDVMTDLLCDRATVEEFLYQEADLLDQWQLDEWLALFAPGARYEVPATDAAEDATSATSLFYIADDFVRLQHRVLRLKSKNAHSESPRSRVFRMVGNVRLLERDGDVVNVRSKFITMRSRDDTTDQFFGHHHYRLTVSEGAIRILSKRTTLDTGSLRPQGRISVIL